MIITRSFLNWTLLIFMTASTMFFLPITPQTNTGGDPVAYSQMMQELFFRYGALFVIACGMMMKPLRTSDLKLIGLFILYSIIISCLMGFGIEQRRAVLNIGIGLILYQTIVEKFDLAFLKTIAWASFWLLVVNLAFCILQIFGLDPIYQHIHPELRIKDPVGLMALRAHLGTLTAILSPLVCVVSPWLALVALPLLWFSKSSCAVLAFAVSFLFIAYKRFSLKVFIPLVSLLVLGAGAYIYFYDMPTGDFFYRFNVWLQGISRLKSNLFFGLGLGSWSGLAISQVQSPDNPELLRWTWAHNEYVQWLVEAGITGLVFITLYIKRMLKCANPYIFGSFIALALVSFLHFPFHLGRLAGVAVIVMALQQASLEDA